MQVELDIGPAVLRMESLSAAEQSQRDSEHITHAPPTDLEEALMEMYPPDSLYNTRLRVEFKSSVTDAERAALADQLINGINGRVPSAQFVYSPQNRTHDVFEVHSSGLLDQAESEKLLEGLVGAVLETRKRWWRSEEGKPYADHAKQQLSRIIEESLPGIDPIRRAQAEEAITTGIEKAEPKLRGVKPENRGAGLAFHVTGDKHFMSQMGSIGVKPELAKHILNELGNSLNR